MSNTNRRKFLLAAIGVGTAAGLGGAAWRAVRDGRTLESVERRTRALGAEVSITAMHCDAEQAAAAIAAAFAELALVEDLMSIYRPDSQLSQLNREGRVDGPHPYLVEVLQAASDISRRTDGAFDVTVQPLWKLYREASLAGRLPEEAEIASARSRVDWQQVKISDSQIRLAKPGAAITLNGIAQGFAADRVTAALRHYGIEHALVNAGEIAPLGRKAGDETWRVGIQHPRDPEAFLSVADLADRCLATSGDYATTFSPDFRHHHLFDPQTGRSPTELAAVSVVAPTAMQADLLSTAMFVLGARRSRELLESLPDVAALFVGKDGRVVTSPGFPIHA